MVAAFSLLGPISGLLGLIAGPVLAGTGKITSSNHPPIITTRPQSIDKPLSADIEDSPFLGGAGHYPLRDPAQSKSTITTVIESPQVSPGQDGPNSTTAAVTVSLVDRTASKSNIRDGDHNNFTTNLNASGAPGTYILQSPRLPSSADDLQADGTKAAFQQDKMDTTTRSVEKAEANQCGLQCSSDDLEIMCNDSPYSVHCLYENDECHITTNYPYEPCLVMCTCVQQIAHTDDISLASANGKENEFKGLD